MPQPAQARTRRDGQVVVATDGQQQPRAHALADSAVAAALLQARSAGQVAKAAPEPAAATASGAAKTAVAAAILAALGRFLDGRRTDQRQALTGQLAESHPDLPVSEATQIVSEEDQREQAYAKKARERVARQVQEALDILDAEKRRQAIERILEQEKRVAVQRENAQAGRVKGAAEQRALEASSPSGAKWVLGDAATHTPDCVAMAGKTWPHSILRTYHPPLHPGCACKLVPADDAPSPPDEALLHAMQMVHDAALDDGDETLADVVEDLYDRRWAKGTSKAGEFRPKRGGTPGRPTLHRPSVRAVRKLGAELDTTDLKVSELGKGDRVMVNGRLEHVNAVHGTPRLVELEHSGLVHIDREHIRGVKGERDPAARPPATDHGTDFDAEAQRAGFRNQDEAKRELETLHQWPQYAQMDYQTLLGTKDRVAQQRNRADKREDAEGVAKWQPRLDALTALKDARIKAAEHQRMTAAKDEASRTGKLTITSSELRQMMSRQGDAYRDAGLLGPHGETPEYTPEAFRTSDLTGAGIRHYVTLPDGRIAHPDELSDARTRGRIIVVDDRNAPPVPDEKRFRSELLPDHVREALAPAAPQPEPDNAPEPTAPEHVTGAPSYQDIERELLTKKMGQAGEARPLFPGFHYAGPTPGGKPSYKHEVHGDTLHLQQGFFRQGRDRREQIVFRHYGRQFAAGLDDSELKALHDAAPSLASRAGVAQAYASLNQAATHEGFVQVDPQAAHAVAAAAARHEMPLHPDAAALAGRTPDVPAPEPPAPREPTHQVYADVEAIKQLPYAEVSKHLEAAGYEFRGTTDVMGFVHYRHSDGALVTYGVNYDRSGEQKHTLRDVTGTDTRGEVQRYSDAGRKLMDRALARSAEDVKAAQDRARAAEQELKAVQQQISETIAWGRETQNINEAFERLGPLRDRRSELESGRDALVGQVNEARRQAFMAELRDARQGYGTGQITNYADGSHKPARALTDEAVKLLPREWVEHANANGQVEVQTARGRGWHYGMGMRGNSTIKTPKDKVGVALHEYTHRLQHHVPNMAQMEYAFWQQRVMGEDGKLAPRRKIKTVPGHEFYPAKEEFRGAWVDPYFGKDYGMKTPGKGGIDSPDPREVMTMAVQSILGGGKDHYLFGGYQPTERELEAIAKRAEYLESKGNRAPAQKRALENDIKALQLKQDGDSELIAFAMGLLALL